MTEQKIHPRVERLATGEVWKLFGIEVIYAEDQQAELHLPVTEKFKQVYGVLHGGVIATVIDMAMGAAFSTTLKPEEYGSTLDLNIRYLKPMTGETLIVKSNIIRRGRRIVVLSAEALNEKGDHIASATGQFMVLERS
ncbi:PaaI family thioesterase [Ammoniphilus resinae]|uniref:Acyl-CoA thioesterase n=1 Tax=Ammoniphilus resinae TaxID=861532 RepID=A0ABS4GUZ7_9BACL|nr:PaaI family thioesterase [Ammoniphilus resinae]MBP1934076.1 acyl-CoA thioesterase [Ammoniphilus resinae]